MLASPPGPEVRSGDEIREVGQGWAGELECTQRNWDVILEIYEEAQMEASEAKITLIVNDRAED